MAPFVLEHGTPEVLTALALTAAAGLSMSLGAAIAMFGSLRDGRKIAYALGLSAGVMVYLSLVELLPEAAEAFGERFGDSDGMGLAALCFFAGMGLMALIDVFLPDHGHHGAEALDEGEKSHHHSRHPHRHSLARTGTVLAVAIGIHNFPEGMATFVSSLGGLSIALPIVLAVAIHNIPAGMAIAVPVLHGTGSRLKAFCYATLSGLCSVVGALAGALVLLPLWIPEVEGICLSLTAGIMVYTSFDELLPSAESYGKHHLAILGVATGMALMALGIWAL